MDLSTFCNKFCGLKVDFDGYYGAQCVDLFRQYCKDVLDIPVHTGAVGGAEEIWTKYLNLPNEVKYFDRVFGEPACGDVVVFKGSPTNSYGHVAIFLAQQGDNVLVFEQDGFAQDGAKYAWRSTRNLIGALRRRKNE